MSNELQETYARGSEFQVPDCAHYFMENLHRMSDVNYIPTKVQKAQNGKLVIGISYELCNI